MAENTTPGSDNLAEGLKDRAAAAVRPADYDELDSDAGPRAAAVLNDIDLVVDVPVQVTVELGRAKMQIRNLLALSYGSVIELDMLAGEPLEVVVNGCLIAQGEVVIVNDRYGIRLTDIVTPAERLRKINR
ncbi:MAG: flagellar motor switch protein FliN [Betaproteobacteria bacterium]|jgi:flagellar motor switch protein FliN/FliY|nr:flagellar motor switch protein FliN [Betaproteobacteria bacterium]